MRPRAQSYRTLEQITTARDAVAWYWRLVALGASIMILGGFLMLPATFDNDPLLRVSQSVVGIFAVALLTAGFSSTALLCFAVRNPLFQADAIFAPSLTSCALGLLTVFYDFLISSRYVWSVPALLVATAAGISTITYGALLLFTHRKMKHIGSPNPAADTVRRNVLIAPRQTSLSSGSGLWQDPTYYENYVRNMYPTSSHRQPDESEPALITEEEMQRQQMLMLLIQRGQSKTPDPTASTFHIDWQGQEADDQAPPNGYYAPQTAHPSSARTNTIYPNSADPSSAYTPQTGIYSARSNDARPWDGVWRGIAPRELAESAAARPWTRDMSRESREERRREIESGN